MKRSLRLAAGLVAVGLLTFVLAGCEGDRGPAGPAGTTECFGCHTDDFAMTEFLRPFQQGYSASQHALGDTFVRRDAPCSRCHTTEGFQAYINTGVETAQVQSSRIHCFACHAPHSNFEFSLRAMGPVALQVEGVATGQRDYDRGPSNTCATCHQARPASPPVASAVSDSAVVTSSRWGVHHGPQANVLNGDGAWVLPGASYSTGPSHTAVQEGCVHCHMAEPGESDTGGHTFRVNYETSSGENINAHGCVDCHDSWLDSDGVPDNSKATTDVRAYQATFVAGLLAVEAKLIALDVISSSAPTDVTVIPGITHRPRTFKGAAAADTLGCVYNLIMLMEDHSKGVHNTAFENDVLAAMKTFLGI